MSVSIYASSSLVLSRVLFRQGSALLQGCLRPKLKTLTKSCCGRALDALQETRLGLYILPPF